MGMKQLSKRTTKVDDPFLYRSKNLPCTTSSKGSLNLGREIKLFSNRKQMDCVTES